MRECGAEQPPETGSERTDNELERLQEEILGHLRGSVRPSARSSSVGFLATTDDHGPPQTCFSRYSDCNARLHLGRSTENVSRAARLPIGRPDGRSCGRTRIGS